MATQITVIGMTCDHCVRSVTEELMSVPGVTHVDVNLENGNVSISSETPISEQQIAQAIESAGYSLAHEQ